MNQATDTYDRLRSIRMFAGFADDECNRLLEVMRPRSLESGAAQVSTGDEDAARSLARLLETDPGNADAKAALDALRDFQRLGEGGTAGQGQDANHEATTCLCLCKKLGCTQTPCSKSGDACSSIIEGYGRIAAR